MAIEKVNANINRFMLKVIKRLGHMPYFSDMIESGIIMERVFFLSVLST